MTVWSSVLGWTSFVSVLVLVLVDEAEVVIDVEGEERKETLFLGFALP